MAQHVIVVVVVGLVVHVANVPVGEANGLGVEVLVLVVRATNRGEEPVEIAPAAASLEEWWWCDGLLAVVVCFPEESREEVVVVVGCFMLLVSRIGQTGACCFVLRFVSSPSSFWCVSLEPESAQYNQKNQVYGVEQLSLSQS